PTARASALNEFRGSITRLWHLLPTLQDWCRHHPCKARFRLVGLAFTGRASNPLDRYKRFQIIHPPFLDLAWRKGSFTVGIPFCSPSLDHLVGAGEQLEFSMAVRSADRLPSLSCFLTPYLFRGVAGLDHDRRGHARVQRAEIFVSAGLREGEGKAIVGVERLRLKQPGCRGDGVRYVVLVAPSHRRSRLHGEARRCEGKIIDFGGCVFRTHRAGKKDDRR